MASKSVVFRFGDVEVREREFTLINAGEVLAVEPKAFRVLLMLLRNPQKLISKEELLNAVWGDAAVTENSLTRSIALLRKLLGDETRSPRYIETVATVGYRFVCKVEVSEDDSGILEPAGSAPGNRMAAEAATNESAPVNKIGAGENKSGRINGDGRQSLRRWLIVGAGPLVVALAAVFWYLHRPLPTPRITEFTQITHDGHPKGLFGSDGTRLFFNRYPSSQPIYQVAVTGGESEQVPVALPSPWLVDVSREDSSLLVIADEGNTAGLWRVGAVEKSLRRLAEGDLESAAWSADGKSVVYSRANGEIYVIRGDGSGARKIASIENRGASSLFVRLTWSPDGKMIRFDRNNRIYEVSADGTGLHEFLPNWRPASWQCCGQWTQDGKLFLFLEWDNPRNLYPHPPFQLWGLDERDDSLRPVRSEPFQLTFSPIRWGWPIPSKDGKKVYIRGANLRGELVRFDPQSHQLQPYLGGISAEGVAFSRDGRFVTYVTFPEGVLWKANRDGSDPVQLTAPPISAFLPRWSPDGTEILFADVNSPRDVIYEVSSQGGDVRKLFPGEGRVEDDPNWSPDGKRIVFGSGQNEYPDPKSDIRILDIASHQVTTIPGSVGLFSPRWSPDGRFIAAVPSVDFRGIKIFDVVTQRWSELPDKEGIGYPAWSRDSKMIYYLRGGVEGGLFRIRVLGGQPERIHELKDWHSAGSEWMGLDPTDAPLLLRDNGTDDIYALTLEEK